MEREAATSGQTGYPPAQELGCAPLNMWVVFAQPGGAQDQRELGGVNNVKGQTLLMIINRHLDRNSTFGAWMKYVIVKNGYQDRRLQGREPDTKLGGELLVYKLVISARVNEGCEDVSLVREM